MVKITTESLSVENTVGVVNYGYGSTTYQERIVKKKSPKGIVTLNDDRRFRADGSLMGEHTFGAYLVDLNSIQTDLDEQRARVRRIKANQCITEAMGALARKEYPVCDDEQKSRLIDLVNKL